MKSKSLTDMSLRYNKLLLQACVLISCFTVISCKKNDKGDHPLVSSRYTFDKPGNYSSLRMFTKLGEVKDQGLINLYAIKFSAHISPSYTAAQDTFRVIDENTAQYIIRNDLNNDLLVKDLVVTKMDNYYQFRSKDTSRFLSVGTDNLASNIGKFKPYYLLTPIPSSTGFNNMVTTFQYYYALTTADGLVFPFINVIRFATLTFQGQPSSTYFNVYRINNVFDEKFPLNTLTADTLLVQTFDVTYKR